MNAPVETLLANGKGQSYWVLGDLYTFKVTGKQTNGTITIIDQYIQPGGGPPPRQPGRSCWRRSGSRFRVP